MVAHLVRVWEVLCEVLGHLAVPNGRADGVGDGPAELSHHVKERERGGHVGMRCRSRARHSRGGHDHARTRGDDNPRHDEERVRLVTVGSPEMQALTDTAHGDTANLEPAEVVREPHRETCERGEEAQTRLVSGREEGVVPLGPLRL